MFPVRPFVFPPHSGPAAILNALPLFTTTSTLTPTLTSNSNARSNYGNFLAAAAAAAAEHAGSALQAETAADPKKNDPGTWRSGRSAGPSGQASAAAGHTSEEEEAARRPSSAAA